MGLLSRRMSSANIVPEIDIAEFMARIDAAAAAGKELKIIDVREPDEYHEGHVPGALLVPLGTVPENVSAFETEADEPVLVICRSGGRSMQAAEFVVGHGANPINVAGGTLAWIEAGNDIVTGSEPV